MQLNEEINAYTLESKKTDIIPLSGTISINQFKKISASRAYRLANNYPLDYSDIDWNAVKIDISNRIEIK